MQFHWPKSHLCRAFRLGFDAEKPKVALLERDTTRSALATLPMAVLGSHLHPPSPDKAGHSKPCLPWTPPWVRLSTPLPPLKPNQALTWLEKTTNSSLNHHHHVQPQWWPMVCKQDRARPQMHNETWRTSLALSLKCMAFLFCPVPMLMLLSLSCGTNNVFTEKATQGADVEL